MKTEGLRLGEKVDLYLGRGPYYRTVVDDIPNKNTLILPIPTFRGISIILKMNQTVQLYFYRENGRYLIECVVIGLDLKSHVRMVALRMLTQPTRQQRRNSFRVETMVKAIIRPASLGPFPRSPIPEEEELMEEVPTFNISATGIAVRTKREYHVGDQIYMRIFLAWPTEAAEPINVLCEIRQVLPVTGDRDMRQLGIMFLNANEDLSSHIAKFVLVEEQRRVRQRKLVEEE